MLTPVLGSVQDARGSSKSFPKHEARHVSDHKVPMILVFRAFAPPIFIFELDLHPYFCVNLQIIFNICCYYWTFCTCCSTMILLMSWQ